MMQGGCSGGQCEAPPLESMGPTQAATEPGQNHQAPNNTQAVTITETTNPRAPGKPFDIPGMTPVPHGGVPDYAFGSVEGTALNNLLLNPAGGVSILVPRAESESGTYMRVYLNEKSEPCVFRAEFRTEANKGCVTLDMSNPMNQQSVAQLKQYVRSKEDLVAVEPFRTFAYELATDGPEALPPGKDVAQPEVIAPEEAPVPLPAVGKPSVGEQPTPPASKPAPSHASPSDFNDGAFALASSIRQFGERVGILPKASEPVAPSGARARGLGSASAQVLPTQNPLDRIRPFLPVTAGGLKAVAGGLEAVASSAKQRELALAPSVIADLIQKEFTFKDEELDEFLTELAKPSGITDPKFINSTLQRLGKMEEHSSEELRKLLAKLPEGNDKTKFTIAKEVFAQRKVEYQRMADKLTAGLEKLYGSTQYAPYSALKTAIENNAKSLMTSFDNWIGRHNAAVEAQTSFTDPGCPYCDVGFKSINDELGKYGMGPNQRVGSGGGIGQAGGKIFQVYGDHTGLTKQEGPGAPKVPLDRKKDARLIKEIKKYYAEHASGWSPEAQAQIAGINAWIENKPAAATPPATQSTGYVQEEAKPTAPPPRAFERAVAPPPRQVAATPPAAAKSTRNVFIGNSCPACASWKNMVRGHLNLRGDQRIPPGVYTILKGTVQYIVSVDKGTPTGFYPAVQ